MKKNKKANVEQKNQDKSQKNEQKESSDGANPELLKKIKEAMTTPLPEKDEYWHLENFNKPDRRDKKILGIFKKKSLTLEEINDLRKTALQTPGSTRNKVQKLKKMYPDNMALYMLSAICTHGMLLNSSNQNEVFRGLKSAVKDAAIALSNDGVSVYNFENFLKLYFAFLDKFRRMQVRIYELVAHDPRLLSRKRPLLNSIQTTDHLISEKIKINNILNHLKKKLKSSHYTTVFEFMTFREAIKHVDLGNPKEKCGIWTATDMITYVHALTAAFARVPVLNSLVDEILKLMPDGNKSLLLRKISISSVRNFVRFKIASLEGDREKMAGIGKVIMKENMTAMQKLDGQALYQSYETDPFFNMAALAQLTVGLYGGADYLKLVDTAIQGVETVVKRDMSKNHVFTEPARAHSFKLATLKEGKPAEAEEQTA